MTYNAFILQAESDADEDVFGVQQFMIWVQSPAGAWLLLQGSWPTPISASRFIDRMGYHLIETAAGLKQLDQQLDQRQREVTRPMLHLKRVH